MSIVCLLHIECRYIDVDVNECADFSDYDNDHDYEVHTRKTDKSTRIIGGVDAVHGDFKGIVWMNF